MSLIPSVVVGFKSRDDAEQITALLSREALRLVLASDAPGVLELVQSRAADLVLLDVQAPDSEGFEVCRRMRQDATIGLVPIVMISRFDDVASRVAALDAGADDFLSRPLERSELVARVRSLLRLKSMRDRLEDTRHVILTLANAAEAKDRFTVQHAERVSHRACELAARTGLGGEIIEQIRTGALIHDVGKIAVPDSVLNKPGPLTAAEFDVVKRHTVVGAEILAPLSGQPELIRIVRSHHERFDGGGYPDGLAGDEIPLTARIVAVCDAFDAMVNHRPYRPAMTRSVALENLLAGVGSQWDRELVLPFVESMRAADV